MIDGEQYIAINAGWGGSPVMNLNRNGPFRTATAKLLVFKLGATGVTLPPMPPPIGAAARRRSLRATEAQVIERPRALRADLPALPRRERDRRGQGLALHDAAGATRGSTTSCSRASCRTAGMASFADVLSPDDAAAIHAYLIARGNEDYADAAARRMSEALAPELRGDPDMRRLRIADSLPEQVGDWLGRRACLIRLLRASRCRRPGSRRRRARTARCASRPATAPA